MADAAQIRELVDKMAEERGKLLGELEAMSEERASTPHKEGEWNQKQQMSHLCEMESAYRAWVEAGLKEDDADVDGMRGERPAIPLEKASEHSVGEHIKEMKRQRGLTTGLIESMKPDDFERRAKNSLFGSLTLMQWLRSYYRHDRMHYDQVRGEEPSYKPQFRAGSEPDQRRGPRIGG
jgi:DinB superfamily